MKPYIKNAFELLLMAGLNIPVTHTSANGIPLGAELNLMKRKYLNTDSGIFQRLLVLKLSDIFLEEKQIKMEFEHSWRTFKGKGHKTGQEVKIDLLFFLELPKTLSLLVLRSWSHAV